MYTVYYENMSIQLDFETCLLRNSKIGFNLSFFKISQEGSSLSHQSQQWSLCIKIFVIGFQMFLQCSYFDGKLIDLIFRRSCIKLVSLEPDILCCCSFFLRYRLSSFFLNHTGKVNKKIKDPDKNAGIPPYDRPDTNVDQTSVLIFMRDRRLYLVIPT